MSHALDPDARAASRALAASTDFGDFDQEVLDDVARLMQRESYAAGEILFEQGQPGSSLMVIESGLLYAELKGLSGTRTKLEDIGPGQVIGELALLGDGIRTITLEAAEDTIVHALDRAAFDVLRLDTREASARFVDRIGHQAILRMHSLYERLRPALEGAPQRPAGPPAEYEEREPESLHYLQTTLFFEGFREEEIAEVTRDLRQLFVKRGTVLWPGGVKPHAFGVVLRGAIETSIRGEKVARRVRLSGPGRGVGLTMLLGDDVDLHGVESRAREDAVLLEIPWPRVRELLDRDDRIGRKFSDAVWSDAVRAVQYGERPLPLTISHDG